MLFRSGALTFTSCKKEDSFNAATVTETDPVEMAATQEATAEEAATEAQYDDVFNITASMNRSEVGEDLGVSANVSGLSELGSTTTNPARCFTITVVPNIPNVFPKTVTIDFGSGCVGRDGKFRKGKIITVFTGKMREPGSKATTTFDGYKVDSVSVAGTHEVTNNSTSNNKIFTTKVIEGKLTWNSGRWVKWGSVRTVAQIEGNGTPFWPLDDIFSITGGGRGENSRGNSWGHEVIEPLIKKFTCRWISKGVLLIRFNSTNGVLNFGNGDVTTKRH